jgi:sirohydrochlorin ferrochelatase
MGMGDAVETIVLVTHGSRDPRPQAALIRLADHLQYHLTQQELAQPAVLSMPCGAQRLVYPAYLELAPQPLHQQLWEIASKSAGAGGSRLRILPLFLLPGVHVMVDIPEEVALARQKLARSGSPIELELLPYLGEHPYLEQLLADQASCSYQTMPQPSLGRSTVRILLSHGSSRSGGHQLVEALATQLAATPAYWASEPSLPTQIARLNQQERQHITVLPYFLFPGSTMDKIAQQIADLRQQHNGLVIQLGETIAEHPAFVARLAAWLLQGDAPTTTS